MTSSLGPYYMKYIEESNVERKEVNQWLSGPPGMKNAWAQLLVGRRFLWGDDGNVVQSVCGNSYKIQTYTKDH